MLHDLANDDGLRCTRSAEDREGWTHRERMSNTCSAQKTTDDDNDATSRHDMMLKF